MTPCSFPPVKQGVSDSCPPDDTILNGEDGQKSKASAPRKAIFIQGSRRLYDLPVLSVADTLSKTH
ncbi:hypothetical protein INS_03319 [Yersinia pestis INS]|nr:hypothetical protein INS_03319 [Yersinia pestis INS]